MTNAELEQYIYSRTRQFVGAHVLEVVNELLAKTDALATPAPLSDEPVADQYADWDLIRVKHLDNLVDALDRAVRKGYMPDAIADSWEAFQYVPAAPPANPSDKQEAVARVVYQSDVDGDTRAFAAWYGNPPEQGTTLYAFRETLLDKSITPERAINRVVKMIDATPAQSAEQDRIDAEKWRAWCKRNGYSAVTKGASK